MREKNHLFVLVVLVLDKRMSLLHLLHNEEQIHLITSVSRVTVHLRTIFCIAMFSWSSEILVANEVFQSRSKMLLASAPACLHV